MNKNEEDGELYKPKIGITMGDFNGIGPEIIIKVLQDKRIMNICTPIVYGSGKILMRYKRILNIERFNYHNYNEHSYLNERKVNVINCWVNQMNLKPGQVTEEGGTGAFLAIKKSTEDLKDGVIDGVVTCPINKANTQREAFPYAGHTEYYAKEFAAEEHLMMLCSTDLKLGLFTVHQPLSEVAHLITPERIMDKTLALVDTLRQDFGITRPKIAILGLNPHAGEDGLLGKEEKEIIAPSISTLYKKGNLVYGPYPADGFFGMLMYKKFDAVLAMYHDQGLVPFKMLSFDEGVNFTAGLEVVRTSPDHGTAYNIAGKGIANEKSLREAIFLAVDIIRKRKNKTTKQIRTQPPEKLRAESKKNKN